MYGVSPNSFPSRISDFVDVKEMKMSSYGTGVGCKSKDWFPSMGWPKTHTGEQVTMEAAWNDGGTEHLQSRNQKRDRISPSDPAAGINPIDTWILTSGLQN